MAYVREQNTYLKQMISNNPNMLLPYVHYKIESM